MRVLINHLTRMHGGHICLAGVDLETHRHVRPLLAHDSMPFYFLARYGGPFDMARIVELGSPRHIPKPPHVEDHVIVPARAKFDRPAAAHEFWGLLEQMQCSSLRQIFGAVLRQIGHGHWGTDPGHGSASLGLLRPAAPPELHMTTNRDGKPRIRMRLSDGQIEADAGVTDLRLHGDDHATPSLPRIRAASQAIADSRGVILGVGLTREFRASDRHEPCHWLQVNNIHLRENPVWLLE